MNDSYLHSFAGLEYTNLVFMPETDNLAFGNGLGIDPSTFSATVKCTTQLQHFRFFYGGDLYGGKDAVVDCNDRCDDLIISVARLYPRGHYGIVCKGGVRNAHFTGRFMTHAKRADVILDDWSDQSHEPTNGIILDLISDDGAPITIQALKTTPYLIKSGSGPYKFLFPQPIINPNLPLIGHPWGTGFEVARRWGFYRKDS